MNFKVPESLKLEHEDLHAELVRATKAGGKTGEAAKAVAIFSRRRNLLFHRLVYYRRWRAAKSMKKCAVFWS